MKTDTSALQHKAFAFKAEKVEDDGTFKGYASVFGNLDSYREIVAPGAFTESLKAREKGGDPLPVLWQHRSAEPIGGSNVLKQDDHGLKVEGWLMVNEIVRAKEAHALLKRRVVTGLSIGYWVTDESWNEKDRVLTLKQLDLVEFSIVTFPANDQARIDQVKAILQRGQLPTLAEFEEHLRDAGFSKTQATAIAGKGLRHLLDRSESGGDPASDALNALQAFQLTR